MGFAKAKLEEDNESTLRRWSLRSKQLLPFVAKWREYIWSSFTLPLPINPRSHLNWCLLWVKQGIKDWELQDKAQLPNFPVFPITYWAAFPDFLFLQTPWHLSNQEHLARLPAPAGPWLPLITLLSPPTPRLLWPLALRQFHIVVAELSLRLPVSL